LPFKKILVPYDGSKQSDSALERAVELAAGLKDNEDVQLVLLHVAGAIPTPAVFDRPLRSRKTGKAITMSEHMEELYGEMEESAMNMLEGKKKDKSASGLSIKTAVEHGKPADKILEYASKEGIDLVIIGNVGAGTKLSKLIKNLGSVSRTISEKASCPVMIVH
jgi:nucleotide-binding universal stress UspA family protein